MSWTFTWRLKQKSHIYTGEADTGSTCACYFVIMALQFWKWQRMKEWLHCWITDCVIAVLKRLKWLSGSIWHGHHQYLYQQSLHRDYACSEYTVICVFWGSLDAIKLFPCLFSFSARKEHAEASYQLMTVQKRLENEGMLSFCVGHTTSLIELGF